MVPKFKQSLVQLQDKIKGGNQWTTPTPYPDHNSGPPFCTTLIVSTITEESGTGDENRRHGRVGDVGRVGRPGTLQEDREEGGQETDSLPPRNTTLVTSLSRSHVRQCGRYSFGKISPFECHPSKD